MGQVEIPFESIDRSIIERIHIQEVGQLYQAFKETGIDLPLNEILVSLPVEARSPIIHTLTTHVTKEKPVFAYCIGRSHGVNERKCQVVAASVDLLWTLALIVDDVTDKDLKRTGRETAWMKFGREQTIRAAIVTLNTVRKKLSSELGPWTEKLALAYVNQGVISVEKQKAIKLDSPINQILANYEEKANFHCRFPVESLLSEVNSKDIQEKAILGLQLVNQAGQTLNDVKDLIPGDKYGRESYSDIRNQTVTLPIKILWESFDPKERKDFLRLFGKKTPTLEERQLISLLIEKSQVREKLRKRILDSYSRALSCIGQVVDKKYLLWFNLWVNYKMGQTDKILGF